MRLRGVIVALAPVYAVATFVDPCVLEACPGYAASNVKVRHDGLSADLVLAGEACNVFGNDVQRLSLNVTYETDDRLHVKIIDPSSARYEVPESILPRPSSSPGASSKASSIQFSYTASPFSFTVSRSSDNEVLFSTKGHALIFEPQYLRVKTSLPANANIYGLGEHTNSFRLPPDNTTLTLWSRDAYGVPTGTNLYGNHPIYFEHRTSGTHGVFLLNSNGMDIKLTNNGSASGGPSLEYNVIGGVLDFYFLAGSESDPTAVARQYAEVVGTPAEVPYWSFGLHQCRFGYQSFVDVANVITRYAAAQIPLETMWTDIDYMFQRRIFTVDPDYFPLARMREIVDYLHSHQQRFVLMTDPAVAYLPNDTYAPYNNGKDLDVWLKAPNGSESLGVVWPGVTVFPDWFHPNAQQFWTNEFESFYNPDTGLDIDGAWIDMNEPSNFCNLPCDDPYQQAIQMNIPPPRANPPPDPNTPIFVNSSGQALSRRDDVDLLNPPYAINNAAGALSSKTAFTNIRHANGLAEYDTHNLYGTMMSVGTHNAMLARRPGKKTLVITRSTFAGAGAKVGKWLGDNFSQWDHYRASISGVLGFAGVYQVPMVGADICGYAEDTTENLCARWAMLGAFYPFMRNHNSDTSISQEFYTWPSVAQAARNALDIRYRLMDYIYTAFHTAHTDGTPVLQPLFFKYPKDPNTFPIDLQFFFGDSVLISPVTDENSTSVSIYLPHDTFYDFLTLAPIQGTGASVTLQNINFTTIPVYIRSGTVLPLRVASTMTTTELRKQDFEFVVAPDARTGQASGKLYIDDGETVSPPASATTQVKMAFNGGRLDVSGTFGFDTGVAVKRVRFLGVGAKPDKGQVKVNGKTVREGDVQWDQTTKVLDVNAGIPLDKAFSVQIHV
ncbi:putative alpha/beta-glucosidase agdC [Psilocybe cubensis]|uniref:Alpha/beta-glucosidase agdC n=2 Tax=Psilocybe cubensis TaxID=181762 RepID=A0ACB8H719_PSICU|nr:putative alpha/beta-glucosidase agdC [Psilocybe cubensis]KAH9483447.1 putative alpha/beta-glucosidase agdC [Psilocybe cubensis]